jgi:hypothetical protein
MVEGSFYLAFKHPSNCIVSIDVYSAVSVLFTLHAVSLLRVWVVSVRDSNFA